MSARPNPDRSPAHLVIACAASRLSGGAEALRGLRLRHLGKLLAGLQPDERLVVEPDCSEMPHERALAAALGLTSAPGYTPWAALHLRQSGSAPGEPGEKAWAWITPCHWQIGMDHVLMQDPAALQLGDDESAALMTAMAPFFLDDGLTLQAGDQTGRWLACGEAFRDLQTASLDRVNGNDIGPWLPRSDAARSLRRLQSEMQMLLYHHPVNDARTARGLAPVNSFWISGAGALPVDAASLPTPPTVELRLRDAALTQDWPRWRDAWQTVDAEACAALLRRHQAGEAVRLTLCGDESLRNWQTAPRSLLQRITRIFGDKPASHGLLLL